MADRAIVFGITANIAFAGGALLAGILAQDPAFDADVVIFHDGLSESQQAAFLALWPRCHFRLFTRSDAEERLGRPLSDPAISDYFSRLTHMVLAKLEVPDLLEDYVRVVWLDVDMLVRGPLTSVWDIECLAWRPLKIGAYERRGKVLAAYADRNLDPSVPLLNGGLIGLGPKFRQKGGTRVALQQLLRDLVVRAPGTQLAEMPWYLLAAIGRLPVNAYPTRFNHSILASGVADATIVHAIGPHKFWNASPLRQLYPDWLAHHKAWVAAGGLPYDGPMLLTETHPEEASQVMRAAETRAFWQKAFRRLRLFLPPGFHVDLRTDQPFLTVFLPGLPEDQHLQLIRMPNGERLRLALQLPEELAAKVWTAVEAAVPEARAEKGGTRSLSVMQIRPALYAVAAALK